MGDGNMGLIKKLSDKLSKGTEIVIGLLLAVMSIVVFLQVIYRYVFHASLPWSEEFARYLLIYLTFLGASVAVKKNAHIGVEAIVKLLPHSVAKAAEWIANVLSFLFFAILVVCGSKVVKVTLMQLSPAMKVKMGYIYLAIVIGGILMMIHLLARTFENNEVEGE